ncbi:MAG: hypothetical protein ACQEP6_02100 [Patescibacteria group bacterium]
MGTLAVFVDKEKADRIEEILIEFEHEYERIDSDKLSDALFLTKGDMDLIERCLLNGVKSVKYHKRDDEKCGIDVIFRT